MICQSLKEENITDTNSRLLESFCKGAKLHYKSLKDSLKHQELENDLDDEEEETDNESMNVLCIKLKCFLSQKLQKLSFKTI